MFRVVVEVEREMGDRRTVYLPYFERDWTDEYTAVAERLSRTCLPALGELCAVPFASKVSKDKKYVDEQPLGVVSLGWLEDAS